MSNDQDQNEIDLLTCLNNLNTYKPPVHTCSTNWEADTNGLVSGSTSIAYLFYRLGVVFPDLELRGQRLWDWAEAYLALSEAVGVEQGWGSRNVGVVAGREVGVGVDASCGGCGIRCERIATLVLRACLEEDESYVNVVLGFEKQIIGAVEVEGEENAGWIRKNDWEVGRAGYLYFLRVLKAAFPHLAGKIQKIIDRIIEAMVRKASGGILDHVKVNTDNIVQVTGIITQIILSRTSDHTANGLEVLANKILALQNQATGDWGPYAPRLTTSFASTIHYFPPTFQSKINRALRSSRQFIYTQDTANFSPHLDSGQGLVERALVFTDLDDTRFDEFLSSLRTGELERNRPDWSHQAGKKAEWVGLQTGEAGRAWVFGVAGSAVDRRVIGYNEV